MFLLTAALLAPVVLRRKRAAILSVWQRCKYHALLIGLGSFGTYLVVVTAFQFSNVSYVVAAREFSVVISVLLGYFVLQKSVSMARWLSLATITIGLGLLPWA
jgi:uncharacterized membrane protein